MQEILLDIRQRLRRQEYKNEEHVRLSLVARVVQGLGWDVWNPTEVYTEFKATKKEDNTRVDVALFTPGFEATAVFIECKGVGAFAADLAAVERQLRDYNRDHTALFTVITDGRHWRFYFSFTSGEFKDKLFCKFDLQEDALDEIAGYFDTFLLRDNILNHSARRKAEAYLMLGKKERAMQDVLPDAQKLVSQPPFPSLPAAMVLLLAAKALTITPAEAQAFLIGMALATTGAPIPVLMSHATAGGGPIKKSKMMQSSVAADVFVPEPTRLIEFTLALSRAGIKATGDWDPTTGNLRVRAGSTAMLAARVSLGPGDALLREKLLQEKVLVAKAQLLVFQSSYSFNTLAQAAGVICGYSVNGKRAWVDQQGRSIGEYVDKSA